MEPFVIRVQDPDRAGPLEHAFLRSPIRIGRSARCDLVLPYPFVSMAHALVEFSSDGTRYTDLGSTNHSHLDGRRLQAHVATPLEPGATVTIGRLRLTFVGTRSTRPGATHRVGPSRDAEVSPRIRPGGITDLFKKLARDGDAERAWRDVLFPGAVIDRFELVREIGRGSFGVVFEARDRQLGRRVAFKAVRPGRHSAVMLRQERLQKEAEAVAQLNHPNIVCLYDAGTCDNGPYLIFELLAGSTLDARLREGRVPLARALDLAAGIGAALAHAHAAGVIHRDLKPANVFLCAGDVVKVLDFGISHVLGAGDASAVGTPAYMAPEQWRQAPQDPRTDVFGAAAMLCEMVTGALPYAVTPEWSAVLEPGARPAVDAPGVPAAVSELLRSALDPAPAGRPRDGQAWLDAVLAARAQVARPDAPRAT